MKTVLDGVDRTLTLAKLFHERKISNVSLGELAEAMRPVEGTEAERRINLFDRDGRFVAQHRHQRAGVVGVDRRPARISLPPERVATFRCISASRCSAESRSVRSFRWPSGSAAGRRVRRRRRRRRSIRSGWSRCSARFASASSRRSASRIATVPCSPGPAPGLTAAMRSRPARSVRSCRPSTSITLAEVHGTELIAFASLSEDELLAEHRRFALATLRSPQRRSRRSLCRSGGSAAAPGAKCIAAGCSSCATRARTSRRAPTRLTGLANRTGFDEARRDAHHVSSKRACHSRSRSSTSTTSSA